MSQENIIESVTDLIGNTPLIRLNNIAPENSAEILGKLESLNPSGSIKDRPCLEMIKQAEAEGLLSKDSIIIEPTTGNTGIGLAMICAVKGYRCILTLPEDLSLERIYLLRWYGAEVVLTPAKKGVRGSIEKAKELCAKYKHSFMPLQFKSPGNPESHRKTTAKEILEATGGRIDMFIAGVGTGGTITGVGEVLKKEVADIKIIAVEPLKSAVLSGKQAGKHQIQGIGAGFIPEILNREIIDEIICVDEFDAYNMARQLGEKEGLSLGISSGANVFASVQKAKECGSDKRIVTILCDSADRYFSLEQYFEA